MAVQALLSVHAKRYAIRTDAHCLTACHVTSAARLSLPAVLVDLCDDQTHCDGHEQPECRTLRKCKEQQPENHESLHTSSCCGHVGIQLFPIHAIHASSFQRCVGTGGARNANVHASDSPRNTAIFSSRVGCIPCSTETMTRTCFPESHGPHLEDHWRIRDAQR